MMLSRDANGRQFTCHIYEQHASISLAVSNRGTEHFPERAHMQPAAYAAIILQKLFSASLSNRPGGFLARVLFNFQVASAASNIFKANEILCLKIVL
jgi:hypothetical protein